MDDAVTGEDFVRASECTEASRHVESSAPKAIGDRNGFACIDTDPHRARQALIPYAPLECDGETKGSARGIEDDESLIPPQFLKFPLVLWSEIPDDLRKLPCKGRPRLVAMLPRITRVTPNICEEERAELAHAGGL